MCQNQDPHWRTRPGPGQNQLEESREALLTDQKIFEELQGQIKAGEKKMAAAEKTLLGN